jgi:hypothetical protein
MQLTFVIAFGVIAFTTMVKADECAALVGKIVQKENAEFTRRSPSGNIYFLTHPLSNEISIDCGSDGLGPMIGIDFDRIPFPNEPMFLLTARLGSMLTGISQATLLKVLHSCHQEALRETQAEVAVRDMTHGVQIECHAFTRDGGASSFYISTDHSAK